MEKSSDLNRWTDDRLKSLDTSAQWQPDIDRSLALLRQTRNAGRLKTQKKMWTVGATLVIALCLLAFPVTRAFARKCVGTCVAGTSQLGHLMRSAFDSPEEAGTPVDQLVGKPAPDFTSADNSGALLRLSDFKGNVIVLNFWATWCSPCSQETPWFIDFQRKYGNRGLVVVGVSLDDDGWKSVRPFMNQTGVNYRVIIGDPRIARLYGGLDSLPTTVIVDRSGRIVATHVGIISHDDLETGIQALLNETE